MLTANDVRAIPLFSTFSEVDLGRLAPTAADLHLGAGEFAVHESGERGRGQHGDRIRPPISPE
jgi:thioredoxin reductase (NADPH)